MASPIIGGRGGNFTQFQSVSQPQSLQDFSPETQEELAQGERRRQIANLLLQQGTQQEPAGQMVGRFYVPRGWASHAGDLAKVLAGVYMGRKVDEGQKAAIAKENEAYANAIKGYQQRISGTPAVPTQAGTIGTSEDDNTMPKMGTPAVPATPEQKQQAITEALLASRIPAVQRYGMQQQNVLDTAQAREDMQQQRNHELAAQREQRTHEQQVNLGAKRELATEKADLAKQQQTERLKAEAIQRQADRYNRLTIARLAAGGKQDPKSMAEFNFGLKELGKDDAHVEAATALEGDLKRWKELNATTETGRVVGYRPGVGQPDFQELKQLENKLSMNNFKPGQGQISNFERQLVKGAGPNTTNDRAANENIVNIMLGGVQNTRERADFKEWYLQTHGKLLGADKMWNDYVEKNPRYIQDPKTKQIVENPTRPDWMTYFSGRQSAPIAAAPAGPSTPTQKKVADDQAIKNLQERRKNTIKFSELPE